eukprot:TRINITY_DN15292_c0_g1_i3.p1 TRINITY_DN15292_c0_g1~~TRINITY_DN15292_c0_g1_i3.p1  ORF type:complete len:252 (+),score=46.32 TRINITY_DN15292_c0_g1_i3:200-955(+)
MAADLILDTKIRDWVLVPLTMVMILIGIVRHLVNKLMVSEQIFDKKSLREAQGLLRARVLRGAAGWIPHKSFRMRRAYLTDEENGVLHVPKDRMSQQAQMMMDPNTTVDMMKKNLSAIIPQAFTFTWVNFFFSGFVTAKIPFPLTQRFRPMLQRGIDLSSLDVRYVSSQSWYFLNFVGLRGFFSLILGDSNEVDDAQRMMQMQMQMGGLGGDASKALTSEKDALELLRHEWLLPKMEQKAEATMRRLLASS